MVSESEFEVAAEGGAVVEAEEGAAVNCGARSEAVGIALFWA